MYKAVLDHGFVILDDHYGDDLAIVNAARQSLNNKSKEIGDYEKGLIHSLMKNGHGTPFEAVDFRFIIKCPISVTREWHRHRLASYNERSGRYTKLDPEFYLPDSYRTQEGKGMSYTYKDIDASKKRRLDKLMNMAYSTAWDAYEGLLEQGVAKELARNVLPVGIYTQFMYKTNLRSLFNFLKLRTHETAMFEIRQYANTIEEMIKEIVPTAWEAWDNCGREAP